MVGNDKDRIKRSSSGSSQLLFIKQKPKNSSHSQKNIEKQFQTSADIERGRPVDYCDYEYSYFEHFDRFLSESKLSQTSPSSQLTQQGYYYCCFAEDSHGESFLFPVSSQETFNCDQYVIPINFVMCLSCI